MVSRTLPLPRARTAGSAPGAIAVLGHYGAANLGDEAIIAATLRELRARLPERELIGISMHPRDTASRHGVVAWPVRRTARSGPATPGAAEAEPVAPNAHGPAPSPGGMSRRILRRLTALPRALVRRTGNAASEIRFLIQVIARCRRLDLLLVTGSNQFLDNFGGAGGYPRTLLQWTLAARLWRVPVAFVSVGAGPLDGRVSHWLIRQALRRSAWHSYRDEPSRALVEGPTAVLGGRVYPDLAFALAPSVRASAPIRPAGTGRVIGINPMPVFDARYWPIDRPELYRAHTVAIARLVRRLREAGERPFLFATQPADERVIDDILERLQMQRKDAETEGLVRAWVEDVDGLLALLGEADAIVATRFHGTVLALAMNRPLLAICYHRKTRDLMHAFGLEKHAVEFEAASYPVLEEGLARVLDQAADIRRREAECVEHYRRLLAEQFDALAALAGVRQGRRILAGRA